MISLAFLSNPRQGNFHLRNCNFTKQSILLDLHVHPSCLSLIYHNGHLFVTVRVCIPTYTSMHKSTAKGYKQYSVTLNVGLLCHLLAM